MNRFPRLCFCAAFAAILYGSVASAQTLISEDFETSTPGQQPNASGFILNTFGDNENPAGFLWSTAQDGAAIDDLIGPAGNKSAVLDNNGHGFTQGAGQNDGPTNATMAYRWTADPSTFTRGFISYDFYLEPAPTDGLTYVDHRLGHSAGEGIFVSTAPNDTVGWYSLRVGSDQTATMQAQGLAGVGAASEAPLVGEVNTMRIDITPGFLTYTLNGSLVTWETPIGDLATLPWFAGAPGVSLMTFVGDFQGTPGDPHGFVFLDNIGVERIPEPTAALLVALGCASLAAGRRRR